MRARAILATAALLVSGAAAVAAKPPTEPPAEPGEFVLSPEGNHLWAYDIASGARQLVIQGVDADEPSPEELFAAAPHRDINGQICVSPDGGHFIAGEDTVLGGGGEGGSSHDPRIAGWGWFTIDGAQLGEITSAQVGKLAPELGNGAGYVGDPDNQGCGFLDADRLFTTAIGNTLPGEEANGQLFLWFGPFDGGYTQMTNAEGVGFYAGTVDHCEIDATLATAGGLAIDDNGDVYVAANRPDDAGNPGTVWRYSGTWPSSMDECTPEFLAANLTKTVAVLPVPVPNPISLTPSSVAISPADTLYVSSVFTGTVSEYTKEGVFLRDIYPISPVANRTGPFGDTPFGLVFDSTGDLWIADLGIVGAGPAGGEGSLIRVGNLDATPTYETVHDTLTFPDGLGVYVGRVADDSKGGKGGRGGHGRPGSDDGFVSTSQWDCGDWGMYGRTLTREFSSDCPTNISPTTVATMAPAWVFRPPAATTLEETTFTASPAVVDGVVYIGNWAGVMYALNAETGGVTWAFRTPPAAGATFGPIVSSAAVADVAIGDDVRRIVVFGSGPRLYAVDAAEGTQVWMTDLAPDDPDGPTEIESSALIYDGVVYVGNDVHDQPNSGRGGVRAFDAATGEQLWHYSSEEQTGQPESGCGGVWGSPTLDVETGLLYFGTSNCPRVNGNPLLPMEEITALVAATGEPVWTFRPHQPAGQSSYEDKDEDFGATPNLFVDATGRKVLGAGSKDGSYYVLDPATGDVIWNTKVVEPAPNVGGFIGSPAVWHGNVFGHTAISQSPFSYHSFDGATGDVRWQNVGAPSYAASTVTNGVVFASALDATLKALDAETGRLLWVTPLAGATSSSAAIVGDMIFIGSGTSSSDLCAKDNPTDDACIAFFEIALGQQGAVHAFKLATS